MFYWISSYICCFIFELSTQLLKYSLPNKIVLEVHHLTGGRVEELKDARFNRVVKRGLRTGLNWNTSTKQQ